jgi:riboflavin transporter FmnP
MILVMVPLNYYLSPLFLVSAEMDYAAAQGYLWSIMWSFVAFNAAKTGINSVVTYLIYKPVSRLFKKEFFAAKGQRR